LCACRILFPGCDHLLAFGDKLRRSGLRLILVTGKGLLLSDNLSFLCSLRVLGHLVSDFRSLSVPVKHLASQIFTVDAFPVSVLNFNLLRFLALRAFLG